MVDFRRLEAIQELKSGIESNIEEKWWLKEKYQPKAYQVHEIEIAVNKILQIFDNEWVVVILNKWLRDQRRHHIMIRQLIEKGSYNLSILVGLGKNLIAIGSLRNIEDLIKDLKNDQKFLSAALEAEIAAECVRKEFEVELYPKLSGKIPDLKIALDSKVVYFEIAEIHPSQKMHSLHKTLNNLFRYVNPLIPENTSIKLTPNKLISNRQFNQIENRLKYILKDHSELSTSFQINDLIVTVEKGKDDWGKSLYLAIPSDLMEVELQRLKNKIKKEAKQISKPNLGVIVVDATNTLSYAFNAVGCRIKGGVSLTENLILDIILAVFEPVDKITEHDKELEVINKIKDTIKEIFEQSNYSNILAVVVIRSFKFFKKKNEAIVVENPYCEDFLLLKKIEGFEAFSRATNL